MTRRPHPGGVLTQILPHVLPLTTTIWHNWQIGPSSAPWPPTTDRVEQVV